MGRRSPLRVPVIATAAAALLAVGGAAAQAPSQAAADRLQAKLVRVSENGEAAEPARLETPISESEVNSYLALTLADRMPPSVSDPSIALEQSGRVTARAIVDLDQVAAQRSSNGGADPLALVGGKVPVNVVGVVVAREGVARVTFQSTTIAGWSVPVFVLQRLVTYYSRSPEHPDGVNLEEPFPLPAGIREIRFGKGQAIIVQ